MFMVHTYTSRGSQRHSRYKVMNNRELYCKEDIIVFKLMPIKYNINAKQFTGIIFRSLLI